MSEQAEPFFYLASPYSHAREDVKVARFRAVSAAAGWLIRSGVGVFCPIAMTHPIELELDEPLPHERWMGLDRRFLALSVGLVQLALPGWHLSRGMSQELSWALQMRLPTMVLNPAECVPVGLLGWLKENT